MTIRIVLSGTYPESPQIVVDDPGIGRIDIKALYRGAGSSSAGGVTDHGQLTGLTDPDHPIAAVSGLQTALNLKAPLISPAFSGVPTTPTAATNSGGQQIASLDFVNAEIAQELAYHAAEEVDPHPQYQREIAKGVANGYASLGADGLVPAAQLPAASGGGGVTDHGLLTGLADDDHTQYHTDARGDARYSGVGHVHTAVGTVREFLIYEAATAPAVGAIHVEATGGQTRRMRVSKVDADGTGYSLAPMLPGDSITLTDDPDTPPITGFARYTVTSDATEFGTYWQFDCTRTDTAGSQTTTPGSRVRFIPTLSGGATGGPIALDDLTDVDTSSAVNGEVLGFTDGTWHPVVMDGGGGGVTDHGALTGLADDDHPHYLTNGRGDARYDAAGTAASGDSAHTGASDPHPQYLTPTEGNAAYATTGHTHPAGDHGLLAGLGDDDHAQYGLIVVSDTEPTAPRWGTIWVPAT